MTSKRHDGIYDDVLSGLDEGADQAVDKAPGRFIRRASTIAEHASGERQEKVLRLVDPTVCTMWERHNRAYELLTVENCRDLIDGILSQGRQEFPAIVRRLPSTSAFTWEVICGARRHFAISWLMRNNYPQFRYLIEERDLTDEEAFRLADIENRDREDISDFERARDYQEAVQRYYRGKQKLMAERLEVSEAWLSRYLQLAKLPPEVIAAFPTIRDIRELHARQLKPLLAHPKTREDVLVEADRMAKLKRTPDEVPAHEVIRNLRAVGKGPRKRTAADRIYRRSPEESGVRMRRKGDQVTLEFPAKMSDAALRAAFDQFLADRAKG